MDNTIPVDILLKHRSKLLAFVRNRLGDADLAEDLFQEALLRAIRKAPEVDEEEQLLAWFYRVLRNAIIDQYRRNAAEERRVESVAATLSDSDFQEVEKELCQCFLELLPALKPEYREMIEKLELGHEDPEKAAFRLGIERNNLKVRRHRARQQLKERLEQTCRTCAEHGCLDCTCKKG
ncbi:MAG: sigma-70 family RNA polymerase sigma factor [Leptospiraceae bacterium]